MMYFSPLRFLLILPACAVVGACGLSAPKIAEPWERDLPPYFMGDDQKLPISATTRMKFEIEKRIYCDLKYAVISANTLDVTNGPSIESQRKIQRSIFPKDWGAQVSINLQVDESISINPGVTFISPFASLVTNAGSAHPVVSPQSSAFGLGATLSSTATRIDKYDPYWSIDELLTPIKESPSCKKDKTTGYYINDVFDMKNVERSGTSPFLIDSVDLGVDDWLVGSMINWTLFKSQAKAPKDAAKAPGPDTMTLQIKFVVVSNGTVTPTWKLARFSANSTGTFFGSGRTRTHDLIITIGPQDTNTRNTHLASQIGQAVSSQNRSALMPLN